MHQARTKQQKKYESQRYKHQALNSSYDAAYTPASSLGAGQEIDMSNFQGDYAAVGLPANSTHFPKGTLSGLGIVSLASS